MNYLNLNIIKQHLNIDSTYVAEDSYLSHLGSAVEGAVQMDIDISLNKIAEDNGGELPPPLLHAMLLLLGNYYANRENVSYASTSIVPNTYNYICDLYRCYGTSMSESMLLLKINELLEKQQDEIDTLKAHTINGGENINVVEQNNTSTINVDDTIDMGDY